MGVDSTTQTAQSEEKHNPVPNGPRVLVAYASKYGSTKGIAEFIGEKLGKRGMGADVRDVSTVMVLGEYDAFVIGSAVFMGHWMKEAKQFVSQNRSFLSTRPVWIFSSGPTGTSETDKKGRNLRKVSGPTEIGELRESLNPRDHHVFFGAFHPDQMKGAMGFFGRMAPKEDQGDFRNWTEIEAWTNSIADSLSVEPKASQVSRI
ncbi:MAG TPA: flavodoxin domain-containing protein [Candidatus Bathyarchaeia archaeon]|nr:flavodoxin domain-containing protein [Candidatus Bathyarchaeia archaeon]